MNRNTENMAMVIQARTGSTRLKRKVLRPIMDRPLLGHLVERLRAHGLDSLAPLVLATGDTAADDELAAVASAMGLVVFRGSESDVTLRFLQCAQSIGIETILRLQGDDPLVDPAGIKAVAEAHAQGGAELTTGAHRDGWVLGTASMAIDTSALRRAYEATSKTDPARLQKGFVDLGEAFFQIRKIAPPEGEAFTDIFLTVDYPEDFTLVESVYKQFLPEKGYAFDNKDVLQWLKSRGLSRQNAHLHEPFD